MILKYLTEEKCNICGSETSRIEICNKHVVTGKFKELRSYCCGKVLIYFPNFDAIEITVPCSHSKEYIEMNKKIEKAKIKLSNFINKLDVCDDWKNQILKCLSFYL